MKAIAYHEFDNFIWRLNSKIGKVQYYLNNETNDSPKVVRSNGTNFTFEFTIYPDKTSEFRVSLRTTSYRKFDSSYLLSKAKVNKGYVYFIKSEFGYKIGCTNNIAKRLKIFEVKLPFKVNLESYIESKDHNKLESMLHNLLSHKRIDGEWFDLTENDFSEIDLVIKNMGLIRLQNG